MTLKNVIDLGGHERMTPKEALIVAAREGWDAVVICGYQGGEFVWLSSEMLNKDVLWISELLRKSALDEAEEDK